MVTVVVFSGCGGEPLKEQPQSAPSATETKNKTSSIEGNWETIWGMYNGKIRNPGKPFQFKTFHDGYFTLIALDSAGKFAFAGYGKYEVSGNNYKETFLWHNNPDYIDGWDEQEYELKSDTLYFKGFKKVVVKGEDKTANFPKIEEKRVRAK